MNNSGNDHGIDKTKAIRMMRYILKLEQENLKTKNTMITIWSTKLELL